MVSPRRGVVLNLSPTHFVIKLILTSKGEPPPKRLLHLRGNFLRTGGVQEQGAKLLTRSLSSLSSRLSCTCFHPRNTSSSSCVLTLFPDPHHGITVNCEVPRALKSLLFPTKPRSHDVRTTLSPPYLLPTQVHQNNNRIFFAPTYDGIKPARACECTKPFPSFPYFPQNEPVNRALGGTKGLTQRLTSMVRDE